jgi:hypothetical protein
LIPRWSLLQSVVQVDVGTMPNRLAQFALDRCRIAVVPISRDPIRDNPGHHPGRTKERLAQFSGNVVRPQPSSARPLDAPAIVASNFGAAGRAIRRFSRLQRRLCGVLWPRKHKRHTLLAYDPGHPGNVGLPSAVLVRVGANADSAPPGTNTAMVLGLCRTPRPFVPDFPSRKPVMRLLLRHALVHE